MNTEHCIAWLDGFHSEPALFWKDNGFNLRMWHRIHWLDESQFLLHVTDGRTRVWRQKNKVYTPRNIQQPTVPCGGSSVIIWGYVSHDCKLDLVTIRGNLIGDQYEMSYNHLLAARPVFMDDNARPHSSRAVTAYLQSEAVTSLPWPAMSLNMNPIEHAWDMLGRRVQAVAPPAQNLHQLEAASRRELRQLPQQHIWCLTGGMRRRIAAIMQACAGFTRYWTLNHACR